MTPRLVLACAEMFIVDDWILLLLVFNQIADLRTRLFTRTVD